MNREPSQPPASDNHRVPDSETRSSGVLDTRRAGGLDASALMTAMAVAPGVYARNRMFAFFKDPAVRRARDRATMLRGLARQLTGSHGEAVLVAFERGAQRCHLKYRVPAIRLERAVELEAQEAACLAYLVARSGGSVLACTDEQTAADHAAVEAALLRLTPPA